jgi:hypothetical protein
MLSLFMLPKGIDKKFDFFVKRVLWNEKEGIKKYHLVNWESVYQPLDQGGLG